MFDKCVARGNKSLMKQCTQFIGSGIVLYVCYGGCASIEVLMSDALNKHISDASL